MSIEEDYIDFMPELTNGPCCGAGANFESPERTGRRDPIKGQGWSSRVQCSDCTFQVSVWNGYGEDTNDPELVVREWNRIAARPKNHKRLTLAAWHRSRDKV